MRLSFWRHLFALLFFFCKFAKIFFKFQLPFITNFQLCSSSFYQLPLNAFAFIYQSLFQITLFAVSNHWRLKYQTCFTVSNSLCMLSLAASATSDSFFLRSSSSWAILFATPYASYLVYDALTSAKTSLVIRNLVSPPPYRSSSLTSWRAVSFFIRAVAMYFQDEFFPFWSTISMA